jgi:hypothetical protein
MYAYLKHFPHEKVDLMSRQLHSLLFVSDTSKSRYSFIQFIAHETHTLDHFRERQLRAFDQRAANAHTYTRMKVRAMTLDHQHDRVTAALAYLRE